MPTLVNTSSRQLFDGSSDTTIATPAYALTAGNLSVIVVRIGSPASSGAVTVADTAGNSYTTDAEATGFRIFIFSAANCLGHASNIVTATFPSRQFIAVTAMQFSSSLPSFGTLDVIATAETLAGVSTTVSVTPTGTTTRQLVILSADYGDTGLPTFTPTSTFTHVYSSGPTGTPGAFIGLGSHSVEYETNSTQHFDGGITITATVPASTFRHSIVVAIYGSEDSDCSQPEVTYEDPCSIKTPHFIGTVRSAIGTTFHLAQTPMRHPSTYLGGYRSPRIVEVSSITRAASDLVSGNFPVQSVTMTLADTDHFFRNALDAQSGDMIRGELWVHLLSEAQRIARGTPRLLFQGLIRNDTLPEHLTYRLEGNDVIGIGYELLRNEAMIPQRGLADDFGIAYGYTNIYGVSQPEVIAAPIIGGEVSDENASTWIQGQTSPLGVVPLIYAGTMTCLDSTIRHVGVLAGHAVKEIVNAYQSNDSGDATALTWGSGNYAQGKTGWATVNPSGAALYTDVNDNRYALLFFDIGGTGDAFADGSRPISVNVKGFETAGDGTGTLITDLVLQYKHVLLNFLLPTPPYTSGPWLASPSFEFYPDGTVCCRVDTGSFTTASETGSAYLGGGFLGGFVIGASGRQQTLRSVLAEFNVSCGNLCLATNQFGQLFVRMLDRTRTTFLNGRRTISDRRDILSDPPFTAPADQERLTNNLRYGYRQNYRRNAVDALNQIGDSPSFTKYGSILADPETYTMIRDDATALAVANERLMLRAAARRHPTWAESLCGLRNDVLDGVPLTHINGPGPTGYADNAVWILQMTIDPRSCRTVFEAIDVDALLS